MLRAATAPAGDPASQTAAGGGTAMPAGAVGEGSFTNEISLLVEGNPRLLSRGRSTAPVAEVEAGIKRVLIARHGAEDFTVTPQQKMLEVFGTVLDAITFAVAAIGAISLVVGGVGILTIMTIAVRERTSEIGLLRALGAERNQVLALFLAEAVVLSFLGGLAGLAVGAGIGWLLGTTVRQLPVSYSPLFIGLSLGLSIVIGLVAGILPDSIDRRAFTTMLLNKHKLSIRPTHDQFVFNGIRFSTHIFNTESEVDYAADVVEKELAA